MNWSVDLATLMDRWSIIETYEGHRREGKIINITYETKSIDGRDCRMPKDVYLNDDTDYIPWVSIKSIKSRVTDQVQSDR